MNDKEPEVALHPGIVHHMSHAAPARELWSERGGVSVEKNKFFVSVSTALLELKGQVRLTLILLCVVPGFFICLSLTGIEATVVKGPDHAFKTDATTHP